MYLVPASPRSTPPIGTLVETQAILVLAEELVDGAGTLAELVEGDWSEPGGLATARQVVDVGQTGNEDLAAHRYGYEFWGIRTASMSDVQTRLLYWSVTCRQIPSDQGEGTGPMPGFVVHFENK